MYILEKVLNMHAAMGLLVGVSLTKWQTGYCVCFRFVNWSVMKDGCGVLYVYTLLVCPKQILKTATRQVNNFLSWGSSDTFA